MVTVEQCCIEGCSRKATFMLKEKGDPYTEWPVCKKHLECFDIEVYWPI